jgi:hypothetical protein
MNKYLSKRNIFVVVILLATALLGIYVQARTRLALGQEPITDIQNIETLRTHFNRDTGKTRLIILVSPT